MTETQFADDTAVYATPQAAIQQSSKDFFDMAHKWGLTVSIAKTKAMGSVPTGGKSSTITLMKAEMEHIKMVEHFPDLGSIISISGDLAKEVSYRVSRASKAFGSLKQAIFHSKRLSVAIK